MGFRKAVAIQDQADDHLLAVRAVVAGVPACGLRIEPALPFEVRRGQVVEVEGVVQGEERALVRGQGPLDRHALGMQPVQIAIQRLVAERAEVGAEEVGQGRAPDPGGHGVLRGRVHQAVQCHELREPLRPGREAGLRQDPVQLEGAPHVMAHVDRARFPVVFGLDLIGVHGDHVGADGRGGARAAARRARPRGDRRDGGIGQEGRLAAQRGRELLRKAAPLGFGGGGERAERTDRAVARALGGGDRLDEKMIDVGLAAHPPARALDEHADAISLL